MDSSQQQLMSLTDSAINQVRLLLKQRGRESFGIRVGVRTGGCSGRVYYVEYADSKNQFDEVISYQELKILIDPKALMYLVGAEMDYFEDQFKSGFIFTNPNEKARCGCGKSFNA